MPPLPILLWSLYIGPTAAGVIVALRALPFVYRLVLARKKPWACDICMGFWVVGAISAAASVADRSKLILISAGPAYALCLLMLRLLTAPRMPPPLPELLVEVSDE